MRISRSQFILAVSQSVAMPADFTQCYRVACGHAPANDDTIGVVEGGMGAALSARWTKPLPIRPFSNTADSKGARGDFFLSPSRSMTRTACRVARSIRPRALNLIIVLLNVSLLMTR